MSRKLSTEFNDRQYMESRNYEIFYFHDIGLKKVIPHVHNHYEYYFFLEGDIIYEIDHQKYSLKPGDFMLIPPGKKHQPHIITDTIPYRRIVLWLNQDYYHLLCQQSNDFTYGYDYVIKHQRYHFRHEFIVAQDIQWKLIELIEEIRGNRPFHDLLCQIKTADFLIWINRHISELSTSPSIAHENPLSLRICDYINTHLTDEISLDILSKEFYVSKYHISHTFKEQMGIGLHEYMTKKRLQAIKSGILSGTPLTHLAIHYGFKDYSSFYRAFKKEYQMSPKEYKAKFNWMNQSDS